MTHAEFVSSDCREVEPHFTYPQKYESKIEARLHSQNEVVFFDNSKLDIGRQFSDQPVIEFPRRPDWNGESDPKRIDEIENREFEAYLEKIHSEHDKRQLSFFEHNIETWRQIWRLIEFADVVAIVADVRHPILHFPPSLYFYIQGNWGSSSQLQRFLEP